MLNVIWTLALTKPLPRQTTQSCILTLIATTQRVWRKTIQFQSRNASPCFQPANKETWRGPQHRDLPRTQAKKETWRGPQHRDLPVTQAKKETWRGPQHRDLPATQAKKETWRGPQHRDLPATQACKKQEGNFWLQVEQECPAGGRVERFWRQIVWSR